MTTSVFAALLTGWATADTGPLTDGSAVAARAPVTIASFPHGAFLENLSVGPDGRLIFTSYLERTLMAWPGEGAPTRLVQLTAHPVGVLSRATDIVISAHGEAFTEGPAFMSSNRMIVLDRQGRVIRETPAPDAMFLNGLVELSPDVILVADSIAGQVWSYAPSSGALKPWLTDPLLTPDATQATKRPGANGLKIRDGWLYISNSSRGALYRVRLAGGRPVGVLETVASPGPIDDFTFLGDGSIAAATHGAKLIRIAPDRTVSDILSDGCDACTSVTPFGPTGDLIVLTTGNLVGGGTASARVLRLSSPVPQ